MNYVDPNFILCEEKCLKQSQDVAPVIFELHNAFYILCTYIYLMMKLYIKGHWCAVNYSLRMKHT